MVALKAWLTEMLKKSDGFSLSIRLTDGSQHACFLFEVLEDALVVVPLGSQIRLVAEGPDEETAFQELGKLIEDGFQEL